MKHRLPLRTDADKARVRGWLDRAPVGKGWRVEFLPPTRTLPQNAQLWASLDDVSAQVEWYGEKLTSEEWKCIFVAALKKQRVVPGVDGGVVVIGAHTSQMSVEDMSDLLELVRAFGSERGVQWGDDTDSPGSGSSSLEPGERASAASGAQGPAGARRNTEDA